VEAILEVARHIPPGQVLTYGDVAHDAGLPRQARFVGWVLAQGHDVPWWRVVRADGVPLGQARAHLRAEGSLTPQGRVDLDRVRWGGAAPRRR
jgi:alkylated DNA nucleotide flippase Atl1